MINFFCCFFLFFLFLDAEWDFPKCDKAHEMMHLLCHRNQKTDSGFMGSDLLDLS